MSDYNMKDAVKMAADGNASDFKDAVSSMLMDKIQDAVGMKKAEVAASFMSEPEVESEVEVQSEPTEAEENVD